MSSTFEAKLPSLFHHRTTSRILIASLLCSLLASASCPSSVDIQDTSDSAPLAPQDSEEMSPVIGTSYFVDSVHGDDGWDGRSPETAWRSLTRVASYRGLLPGDGVFLRRGCVWRETLKITGSGNRDHMILFSSYGEGAQPLINGSDVVSAWDDTEISGVLVTNVPSGITQVFEAGARLEKTDLEDGQNTPDLTPGQWALDDSRQLLFVAPRERDEAPTGRIEIATRTAGIEGHQEDYITIHDLAVTQTRQDGISTGGGDGWVIDGATSTANWRYGVKAGKGSENTLIQNSKASDNGVGFGGHDVSGLVIRNNTTSANVGISNADGINVSWSDGVVIEGNLSTGNNNGDSADGIQCAGCQGVVIRQNTVEDNRNAAIILTLSQEPSYGLIEGNTIRGAKLGIAIMTDGETTTIRNNTIHNSQEAGIKISKATGQPEIFISGNAAIQESPTGYCLSVPGPQTRFVQSDDNCYSSLGQNLINWGNITYHDLATYQQATGQDADSNDNKTGSGADLPRFAH